MMLGQGRQIHGGEVLRYDPGRSPFAAAVARALGVTDLARLHEEQEYPRLTRGTDHATVWHERFYQGGFAAVVAELYSRFLLECVRPLWPEPVVYQRVPSLRVHLPGNVGVGEFHTDGQYGHPAGELNCLLPLTSCRETASIWIESREGLQDYRPVNLEVGELFLFRGRDLRHGNFPNETGRTRVSLDFRLIPLSQYRAGEAASVNSGLRFALGGYYAEEPLW